MADFLSITVKHASLVLLLSKVPARVIPSISLSPKLLSGRQLGLL
jgi:hypothetical protein